MLEENNKTGTNMLQHTITDEAITETTNEMTFASLGMDEMEDNETSFVFTQDVRNFEMQHRGRLPPEWILLETNQPWMSSLTGAY